MDNDNISATAAIVGSKLDLTAPGNIGSTTPATGEFITLTVTNVITEFSTDGTFAGDSDGVVPTEKAVKTYINSISIPAGGIIMWSGSIASIPNEWALCDGTQGTPDLTDRFVIHADADAAGTNNVGDTGGSKTYSLPSHTHAGGSHTHPQNTQGGSAPDSGLHSITAANATGARIEGGTGSGNTWIYMGSGVSTGSGTTGSDGDESFSIRDKYYALAYIMKL